jgi:hypothetical protein
MPWRRSGGWRHSSTHSLTSAIDGGEWSASRPGRFTPRKRSTGTHWIGSWVGPRAVLDTVKVKVVPALFLTEHHATKACWGSGGTAPRILNLVIRWRWVVNFTSRPLCPQGKSPWYPVDRRLGGPQISGLCSDDTQYHIHATLHHYDMTHKNELELPLLGAINCSLKSCVLQRTVIFRACANTAKQKRFLILKHS